MGSKVLKKLFLYSLMPIAMFSFGFMQAQITVSGTISGENGPIPGVNILVQGSSNGTQSDFDGNYTIKNVEEDAILVFSYIGFQTQEIPVNGRETIDVALKLDQESLEEVVLVGYGSQLGKEVTGAV